MSLVALLSLLSLGEDELLIPPVVVLLSQFGNSVFCHFSFDVLAFFFACLSMLVESISAKSDKFLVM
jgi:hypothetical protein